MESLQQVAMRHAASQLGYNEQAQNAALQDYLSTGGAGLNPQETAWCAAFVNASLGHAGIEGTGSNMARSFLDWGQAVETPQAGDVAVFTRGDPNGPYGHVGFYAGQGDDGIKVLGGNQSDSVSYANYPEERLLGYRRAPGIDPRMASTDGAGPAVSPHTLPDRGAAAPVPAPMPAGVPPVEIPEFGLNDALLNFGLGVLNNQGPNWFGSGLQSVANARQQHALMAGELYELEQARQQAAIAQRAAQQQAAAQEQLAQQYDEAGDYNTAAMIRAGLVGRGDLLQQDKSLPAAVQEALFRAGGDEERAREILAEESAPGPATYGVRPYYERDEDGQVYEVRYASDGTKIRQPVEGTPFAVESRTPEFLREVEEEKTAGRMESEARTQKKLDFPQIEQTTRRTVDVIDQLLADEQGMRRAVGFLSQFPNIPGGKAADYMARLEQLYGLNFLKAYEDLKGGGQITEIEGRKAEQAIAALATSQSIAEHRRQLQNLREVLVEAYERQRQEIAPDATSPFTERSGTASRWETNDWEGFRVLPGGGD